MIEVHIYNGAVTTTARTAAVALALVLAAGVLANTQSPSSGWRQMVADTAPPGIDTGVNGVLDRTPASDPLVLDRSSTEPFVRGSVIVKFREGTPLASQRAILLDAGATALDTPSYANFAIMGVDATTDPERAAAHLAAQPDVEYAQPRYRMHSLFVPNDPLYTAQWNLQSIGMEQAWDINLGGTSSVVVAVLDSGVAYRNAVVRQTLHAYRASATLTLPALGTADITYASAPDLGGPDRFVAPRDFIWNDNSPLDTDGHGTHVAGTIGQLTNNGVGAAGVAFNVRLMPVKVIDSVWDEIFGSPFVGTDDVVARGVRYAVDNGAKVLNMSIGRGGPPAPVVQDAISYAVRNGAFVAVAAGNDFERGNVLERIAEFAPQIQGMMAVGAIGRDRQRAYYSNIASYIEIVAPGGNQRTGGVTGGVIQQTYNFGFTDTYDSRDYRPPRFDVFAYHYLQGTSMATPHVAGLAALLYQQGITNPAAIEAAIERFATDLGAPGKDTEFGHGLINPRATLRGLGLAR